MKVVVTGGAGFISANLCAYLGTVNVLEYARRAAVILAIGPAGIIPALFVAPGLFVHVAAQSPSNEASRPLPPVIGVIVRAAWLVIALLGLLALIGDIRAINRFE